MNKTALNATVIGSGEPSSAVSLLLTQALALVGDIGFRVVRPLRFVQNVAATTSVGLVRKAVFAIEQQFALSPTITLIRLVTASATGAFALTGAFVLTRYSLVRAAFAQAMGLSTSVTVHDVNTAPGPEARTLYVTGRTERQNSMTSMRG